jgi:hypothetical protein
MLFFAIVFAFVKGWWMVIRFFFKVGWKLATVFAALIVFAYFLRACNV